MDAVAWKNVVFLGLSFPVSLNVPLVPVFAGAARLSAGVAEPRAIATVRPAAGSPPLDTRPDKVYVFMAFLYDACRLRMIGSGTNARASNVPAVFGVPLPGLYGVKSASHSRSSPPVGVVKMTLTVNVASSRRATCAARAG